MQSPSVWACFSPLVSLFLLLHCFHFFPGPALAPGWVALGGLCCWVHPCPAETRNAQTATNCFAFFSCLFFFASTSAHSGGFLDSDLGGWLSHAALRTEKKNPFPFFLSLSLPRVGALGPTHVPFVRHIWATPLVQLKHRKRHQQHLYQPIRDRMQGTTPVLIRGAKPQSETE